MKIRKECCLPKPFGLRSVPFSGSATYLSRARARTRTRTRTRSLDMASQPRKGGVSLPERQAPRSEANGGIISKLTESPIVSRGRQAACDAAVVTKKLLKSTGKAAWIAGTTFLILVVPLIIEMDREQQFNELELQQASLLGTPPQPLK